MSSEQVDNPSTETSLENQLQELRNSLQGQHKIQSRMLDEMRRDISSERAALASKTVFTALAGPIDQMTVMRDGLDPKVDSRMQTQLDAVLSTLQTVLRTLGFVEFNAKTGEIFDPQQMTVVGYSEGPKGMVVECVQPGYRAGETVLRPVSVKIGHLERAE